MRFRDRDDAARQLVTELRKYKGEKGVVVAIPRGAVPMGETIAKELGFQLDIVLTKKIGHPANPEFAIGAVSTHGAVVSGYPGVSEEYIKNETERIKELLSQRYQLYRGNRKSTDLTGKTVIIVDDGIATGNTMKATIELIKESKPQKLVVAVPVAPPETVARLSADVDELVCLYAPEWFEAVGQFYEDFPQVSDEEVIALLQQNNP
ncbi:phosphoribosyltransferase [Botryobacter ruber]|uniref:phosphoribosyltransferase n=1 Tax=Botryobacter ruber TaxID=2171629 RepID=UPI000E09F62F|nr:phosphoribosyltransferase [Botryobacter ruber]